MGWDEVRVRGRQELAKRRDAIRPPALRTRLRAAPPAQFFFAPEQRPELLALLRERCAGAAEATLAAAGQILRHRFTLLGYEDLDYGPTIDWHRDAAHGRTAPRVPWFAINLLDPHTVGDSKVTAELSRHQHLVTLAQACCLTGDLRFAREIAAQWRAWQRENPYPLGVNWASSLDVAFRSLAWLWVWHLLAPTASDHTEAAWKRHEHSGRSLPPAEARPQATNGSDPTKSGEPPHRDALGPGFELALLRGLARNGGHIERYLSTYSSPNTHLLGEGVGLFFIGTLCPQLGRAARWQRLGWRIVQQEAQRQVHADGMHFEQSLYYHVYALDFFLHARILAARNGLDVPAELDRTLERMLEALALLAQAGPPPRSGDDDGGRVFDPRRNRPEHMADPLSTGALLFGRADFKAAAGALRPETLWLLGPEAAARWDALPVIPVMPASAHLAASGSCIMAAEGEKLVLDAGPLGTGNGGHGHADALHLDLTLAGRRWLVDPGACCYLSEGNERDLFRGTAAHNTLQVDGLDQAEPAGPFVWRAHPTVRVEGWTAGRAFNFFRGSHDGYARLPQPVMHERRVFHLKNHFWLVYDRALGQGRHQLALHWHLDAGLTAEPGSGPGAVGEMFRAPDGAGLAILPVEGHGWQPELIEGAVSPAYGRAQPAPVLRYAVRADLPADFATLLAPAGAGLNAFRRRSGTAAAGFEVEAGGERHLIVFALDHRPWEMDGWAGERWTSDADAVYIGGAAGRERVIVAGGTFLDQAGARQWTAAAGAGTWEPEMAPHFVARGNR